MSDLAFKGDPKRQKNIRQAIDNAVNVEEEVKVEKKEPEVKAVDDKVYRIF